MNLESDIVISLEMCIRDRLIVDLVGRYPANYLIRREAISER